MNDKIKEILDYWQFYINEPNNYKLLNIHFDEIKKVLDYITNLQKQIEEYQKALDETMSEKIDLQEENQRLLKNLDFMIDKNDEKQKVIDEAIEKLEYYSGGEADWYVPIDDIIEILKGSDK